METSFTSVTKNMKLASDSNIEKKNEYKISLIIMHITGVTGRLLQYTVKTAKVKTPGNAWGNRNSGKITRDISTRKFIRGSCEITPVSSIIKQFQNTEN